MKYPRNEKLLPLARQMRKNMTKEERRLWYDCLRYCEPRFRRQEIIGNYIVDFFVMMLLSSLNWMVLNISLMQELHMTVFAATIFDPWESQFFGIPILRSTKTSTVSASTSGKLWMLLAFN